MQIAKQVRNEKGQNIFEFFRQGGGGGVVHCQFGEMEHAIEESSGAGKAMSRHDARNEAIEWKTRSSDGHGGRQDQVAEQSDRKSTMNRSLRR